MVTKELLEKVKEASIFDQAKIVDEALDYITHHVVSKEEMELFVNLLEQIDEEVFTQIMYLLATHVPEVHERLMNIETYLDLVLKAFAKLPEGECK